MRTPLARSAHPHAIPDKLGIVEPSDPAFEADHRVVLFEHVPHLSGPEHIVAAIRDSEG